MSIQCLIDAVNLDRNPAVQVVNISNTESEAIDWGTLTVLSRLPGCLRQAVVQSAVQECNHIRKVELKRRLRERGRTRRERR
jgi:hypothetical protein